MDVPRGGLTATGARAPAPAATLAPAPRPSASGVAGGHDPQRLLLFPWSVADGAGNMALDEAMMELARSGGAALRFYGWSPFCLSLGRNQRAGRPRPGLSPGVEVVRRPTGGRSVFHGPEITYSITFADRALGGPRAAYARINRALASGLAEIGVRVDRELRAGAKSPRNGLGPVSSGRVDPLGAAACFADPAPGELTVGGRKLVGSAQWRHRGAILQHGSILIEDEQERGALAEFGDVPEGIGLVEILNTTPPREAIIRALIHGFRSELELPVVPGAPPNGVRSGAAGLEARYRGADWTWRR